MNNILKFLFAFVLVLQFSIAPVLSKEYFPELRVFKVSSINAKASGTTLVCTTENGNEDFHPLFVVFKLTSGAGIIVVPIISIGTNASSYNNIVSLTALTGLTSTGTMLPANFGSVVSAIPPNTQIFANISTIAVGTTAVLEIHVIGYYY